MKKITHFFFAVGTAAIVLLGGSSSALAQDTTDPIKKLEVSYSDNGAGWQ